MPQRSTHPAIGSQGDRAVAAWMVAAAVVLAGAFAMAAPAWAESATLPGTLIRSWTGNSLPGGGMGSNGANTWVQLQINDLCVMPDGVIYGATGWEEGCANVQQYSSDGKVIAYASGTHGWGWEGAHRVTANARFVYFTQQCEGPFVCGDPEKTVRFGIDRRNRSHLGSGPAFSHIPVDDHFGGHPPGTFLNIHSFTDGRDGLAAGLCANDDELFVSCPVDHTIHVYDAQTMAHRRDIPCADPGRLCLDQEGFLWNHQQTTNQIVRFSPAGVQQPQQITLSSDMVMGDLCTDAQGRLWVADCGRNEQLVSYRDITTRPTRDTTFGTRYGISAGTPGEPLPLKFTNVQGIGLDQAGNIYVANQNPANGNGGYGVRLEAYRSSGERRWALYSGFFGPPGAMDPLDERSIYTGDQRYTMDYRKPAGQEWSLGGVTIDRWKYPDDARLHLAQNMAYTRCVTIAGRRFLFVTGETGGGCALYRFDPRSDGEIAIPAMYHNTDTKQAWPPHQPKEREYFWIDADGDGQMDADEFIANPQADLGGITTAMDAVGTLWMASDKDGIRSWPCRGLDKHGVPAYDFASMVSAPMPAPFIGLRRVEYVPETDTLYLSGFTAGRPEGRYAWKHVGRVMAKYPGWSTGIRTAQWTIDMPFELNDQELGGHPVAFAVCNEYLFVAYDKASAALGFSNGHVQVYRTSDGTPVGAIEPTDPINKDNRAPDAGVGTMDNPNAIRAAQRPGGEYLIMQEEDACAKGLLYRWSPLLTAGPEK